MAAPIQPISIPALPELASAGSSSASGSGFAGVLSDAIESVNGLGRDAAASVEKFLSGDGEDLHTTVLATTRAELAFDLFLETRNNVSGDHADAALGDAALCSFRQSSPMNGEKALDEKPIGQSLHKATPHHRAGGGAGSGRSLCTGSLAPGERL
jgi:flagellar hook-basal body complex protein FliE